MARVVVVVAAGNIISSRAHFSTQGWPRSLQHHSSHVYGYQTSSVLPNLWVFQGYLIEFCLFFSSNLETGDFDQIKSAL